MTEHLDENSLHSPLSALCSTRTSCRSTWLNLDASSSIQPSHKLYWTTGYRQPMPTRCGKNTAAPWATLPASSRPLGIRLSSGVIKSALDFAGLTLMDFHHHAAKKHTDWQRNFECVGAGLSPTAFKIMGCPDSLQHVRNCGAGASLSTLVNL